MGKVSYYIVALLTGIMISQLGDLAPVSAWMHYLTTWLLGYIMMGVGLECHLDKTRLRSYGKDYLVATAAATFPWILCSIYLWQAFPITLSDAALVGRFAAPTSAGVLFTLLAAAGLSSTWVFYKTRILAILDDLDTLLLIIPLQMIRSGFELRSLILISVLLLLLALAWRFLHRLKLPTSSLWLLFYAAAMTLILEAIASQALLNIEILLPAFVLGAVLKEQKTQETPKVDTSIKLVYLILVGASLPPLAFTTYSWSTLLWHVILLTLLANIGKLYPLFCYKNEASFRERAALSIAMWPRGEVGAGILLLSMNYAIDPAVIQVAGMSLALNLCLTGVFIYWVIALLRPRHS